MSTKRISRRQKQALDTRRDVLAAARKLFASHGYAATSMAAIADEAGTAVQTIYDSVGSKRDVLLALQEYFDELAGTEASRVQREAHDAPQEVIAEGARLTRYFSEQLGDILTMLVSTMPQNPDVAAMVQEGYRRHRIGVDSLVRKLDALDALRPDVDVERAVELVSALTWNTTYQQLVELRGWSFDECERWMTDTICHMILREPER